MSDNLSVPQNPNPQNIQDAQLDALAALCERLCLSFPVTWCALDEMQRDFDARLEAQREADHA